MPRRTADEANASWGLALSEKLCRKKEVRARTPERAGRFTAAGRPGPISSDRARNGLDSDSLPHDMGIKVFLNVCPHFHAGAECGDAATAPGASQPRQLTGILDSRD